MTALGIVNWSRDIDELEAFIGVLGKEEWFVWVVKGRSRRILDVWKVKVTRFGDRLDVSSEG